MLSTAGKKVLSDLKNLTSEAQVVTSDHMKAFMSKKTMPAEEKAKLTQKLASRTQQIIKGAERIVSAINATRVFVKKRVEAAEKATIEARKAVKQTKVISPESTLRNLSSVVLSFRSDDSFRVRVFSRISASV